MAVPLRAYMPLRSSIHASLACKRLCPLGIVIMCFVLTHARSYHIRSWWSFIAWQLIVISVHDDRKGNFRFTTQPFDAIRTLCYPRASHSQQPAQRFAQCMLDHIVELFDMHHMRSNIFCCGPHTSSIIGHYATLAIMLP